MGDEKGGECHIRAKEGLNYYIDLILQIGTLGSRERKQIHIVN